MIDFLLSRDLLPDAVLRPGIRRLLAQRLREEIAASPAEQEERLKKFVEELRSQPRAIATRDSRAQHYEVPTGFYQLCLGPRLKYSSAWFERGDEDLETGERAMLELTAARAQLLDGQRVLELGCGWGSLSLWLAGRHPRSRITAVSHSATQRRHIESEAQRRGLFNLRVITCDMNDFDIEAGSFDRVVSVEMFEHMKNWPELFQAVQRWLHPGGLFFLHVFTHARGAYHFVARDDTDWMSRHFFTGGMMPSDDLALRVAGDLVSRGHWRVNGRHYQRTAMLWRENMEKNRAAVRAVLAHTYGEAQTTRWWVYWRVFFLACEELWGYRGGTEWQVSHYVFARAADPAVIPPSSRSAD